MFTFARKAIASCGLLLVAGAGLPLPTVAQQPELRSELQPLAFLEGHCWRGRFDNGAVDRHCYEAMLGGMELRDRNELVDSDPPYRGETIWYWNGKNERIEFIYFNTDGGVSTGHARVADKRIEFPDEVFTSDDGTLITVRTTWLLVDDSTYVSLSAMSHGDGPAREMRVTYRRE